MKLQSLWYASACIIAVPLSSIARAESADEQTIIVTASVARDSTQESANQTPGGTDIVGHEEYANKSLVSLRDTLAFSPGVYLQPRYGQEIRISMRGSGLSRGFHMRGLTLLQDGIPINLADDNGDFLELEPIFFDRLEVYRGANALRLGSATLGGAINGVTPDGKSAHGVYVRADVGSFDSYRVLLSGGTEVGAADVWGGISADSSHGDRDHGRRDSRRFHGNVGLKLSDIVRTRFYASLNDIDQEIPGALTISQALVSPGIGNAASVAGDHARNVISLRFQNRTSFDFGSAKLDIGMFLNAKSLFHPIFQVVDQNSTDRGFLARIEYAKPQFALTLGAETRIGDVASKRFLNLDGKRGAPSYGADQHAQTTSIYGEIRFRLGKNMSLIAGGIYAQAMREQLETYNLAAGGAVSVKARADFHQFSPKIGLLFNVSEDLQLYGNYSRAAEFPGFIELAQISRFVPIAPQSSWTGELGSRGSVGPAKWDISVYRARVSNELLQYTIDSNTPSSTFNAGTTIHQGIEMALSLVPTNWLRIRKIFQYSDFRFRGDEQYGDNRLPVVPRILFRAEIRFGNDFLHIAPNFEWVPQGPFADYDNTLRTNGYKLIGATAGARVGDRVDLFLDARNLAGERAIGDISAVIRATPAAKIYYPVERRAIFGGVRARF